MFESGFVCATCFFKVYRDGLGCFQRDWVMFESVFFVIWVKRDCARCFWKDWVMFESVLLAIRV